jgi:sugar/nucleoside kinase (ribokinase family)
MGYQGLFVGLTTLDLIYRVDHLPHTNEKQVATDLTIAAGGPATNAAVTFCHLGNQAILLSGIGQHPVAELLQSDLKAQQINCIDLWPDRTDTPPLSSITVTPHNGDRVVVSCNALNWQASPAKIPTNILDGVDIVLIDGHQIETSVAIAQRAKRQNIPIILDGGSWKPGLEKVLPFIDYAICSADFWAPGCTTSTEVMVFLQTAIAQPNIAITHGGDPIQYLQGHSSGQVPVAPITPLDTLGAGDAFHGAFCYWILQTTFAESLARAGAIATKACQEFGTRSWLKQL